MHIIPVLAVGLAVAASALALPVETSDVETTTSTSAPVVSSSDSSTTTSEAAKTGNGIIRVVASKVIATPAASAKTYASEISSTYTPTFTLDCVKVLPHGSSTRTSTNSSTAAASISPTETVKIAAESKLGRRAVAKPPPSNKKPPTTKVVKSTRKIDWSKEEDRKRAAEMVQNLLKQVAPIIESVHSDKGLGKLIKDGTEAIGKAIAKSIANAKPIKVVTKVVHKVTPERVVTPIAHVHKPGPVKLDNFQPRPTEFQMVGRRQDAAEDAEPFKPTKMDLWLPDFEPVFSKEMALKLQQYVRQVDRFKWANKFNREALESQIAHQLEFDAVELFEDWTWSKYWESDEGKRNPNCTVLIVTYDGPGL